MKKSTQLGRTRIIEHNVVQKIFDLPAKYQDNNTNTLSNHLMRITVIVSHTEDSNLLLCDVKCKT